jgi:16S rRNA processing protein RimM
LTAQALADLVAIGRVVKPQGRKGEVLTESLSDQPERFPSLRHAYLVGPDGAAREVEVASCWLHKGRFVLKLAGVDSIDEAERLRGQELRIREDELAPLPEGSYYYHQLQGLRAETPEGRPLGTVASILETGAGAPVLVVKGPEGERLIPLAAQFVREVDLAGGRLVALAAEPEK